MMFEEPPIGNVGAQIPEVARRGDVEARHIGPGTYTIDGLRPLYPPEDIGLPSEEAGYQNSVVGEVSLPITRELRGGSQLMTDASAVITRVSRADTGEAWYMLRGLGRDGRGQMCVLGSVRLSRGDSLKLGRHGDSAAHRAKDSTLVSAAQLWGDGVTFGDAASREHIELRGGDSVVHLVNRSQNGTLVTGNFVEPPQQPQAAEITAPSSANEVTRATTVGHPVAPAQFDWREQVGAPGSPAAVESVADRESGDPRISAYAADVKRGITELRAKLEAEPPSRWNRETPAERAERIERTVALGLPQEVPYNGKRGDAYYLAQRGYVWVGDGEVYRSLDEGEGRVIRKDGVDVQVSGRPHYKAGVYRLTGFGADGQPSWTYVREER